MNTVAEGEKVTLMDAYRRYGVSPATLRYWLDRGDLQREYVRGRVVVDVAQLEKLLREKGRLS